MCGKGHPLFERKARRTAINSKNEISASHIVNEDKQNKRRDGNEGLRYLMRSLWVLRAPVLTLRSETYEV